MRGISKYVGIVVPNYKKCRSRISKGNNMRNHYIIMKFLNKINLTEYNPKSNLYKTIIQQMTVASVANVDRNSSLY